MLIFVNEDRGYLNWVKHHRQGYVLEGRRRPKIGHLIIHRASCGEVNGSAAHKRTHWTTGRKFKACSLDRQELKSWSAEETGVVARCCDTCQPDLDVTGNNNGQPHLSKLSAEIVDYVLDAALIHMEHEVPPYRLTLSDIAACFNKTPGQISPVVHRLIDEGFLSVIGRIGSASPIPVKRIVLPTILAMKSLEAFRCESDSAIQTELDKLTASADPMRGPS